MSIDQEPQADATRYVYYSIAAMTVVLLVGFLYLFNFTSFFKLASPL